jgi:hypothetical protein
MTKTVLKSVMVAAMLAVALSACRKASEESRPVPGELTLPSAQAGQSSDAEITLIPPGFERAASGLSFLFHVNGDVFGTVDPIDGDVLFLNPSGKQLGAARLPDGFSVRDIDIGSSIVLRGATSAVVIPRTGAIPAQLLSIPLPASSTSVKRNGRALEQSYKGSGGSGTLSVGPRGTGKVLNVTFLGFDQDGRPYAYWEEGDGRRVDSWAGRFGSDGKLDAAALLDFSDFDDIPAVPVAVTPSGSLLMMQPTEDSVELNELTLVDGRAGAATEKKVGSPPVNILDVGDAKVPPVPNISLPAVRGKAPPYDAAFGAATLARARQYLDAQWTLKPGNFLQSGIQHNCEPEQGLVWSRPTRLSEAKLGKTVSSLPYKWGGFDSVDQFKSRMASSRPALAGNVCTCRQAEYNGCMVARAAGVDCSGFVSRAWGLKAHNGTFKLASIAAPLPTIFDLKPGDILNRPGNHVRLFVGFEPGPEVRLRTLESAVSCGGVCERVFTPAQLQYYRPMRLRRP